MSSRQPGAVVLVEVPFTDLSQSKKRPALVLLSRGQDHLVVFFTSRLEQAGPDDMAVTASASLKGGAPANAQLPPNQGTKGLL